MRPELVSIEIVAESRVEGEAVTVQTDYRHNFRQTPLHIRAASQQVHRAFEKRGWDGGSAIAGGDTVTQPKFFGNDGIEFIVKRGMLGDNDHALAV
jgi:hypothetical protein